MAGSFSEHSELDGADLHKGYKSADSSPVIIRTKLIEVNLESLTGASDTNFSIPHGISDRTKIKQVGLHIEGYGGTTMYPPCPEYGYTYRINSSSVILVVSGAYAPTYCSGIAYLTLTYDDGSAS